MGTCAFCSKEEKLTSEHIWGEWIQKFVPPTKNKHQIGYLTVATPGNQDEESTRIRAGDPINAQAEILCKRCNNVELGGIQDATKKLMVPLLRGEKCLLGESAQRQISTWATMAAMTAEFLIRDPSQIAITQEQRTTFLEKKEPPTHWKIWIGSYKPGSFSSTYVHASLPIMSAEEVAQLPDPNDPPANTQASTFFLGNLCLHILSSTPVNWPYVRDWNWINATRARIMLAQIWPPRDGFVLFPFSKIIEGQDARDFSTAYFNHVHNVGRINALLAKQLSK